MTDKRMTDKRMTDKRITDDMDGEVWVMRERFVERLEMLREQEARLGGMLRALAAQLNATMGARQECEYWLGEIGSREVGSREYEGAGDAEADGALVDSMLAEAEADGALVDSMLAEAAERLALEDDEG